MYGTANGPGGLLIGQRSALLSTPPDYPGKKNKDKELPSRTLTSPRLLAKATQKCEGTSSRRARSWWRSDTSSPGARTLALLLCCPAHPSSHPHSANIDVIDEIDEIDELHEFHQCHQFHQFHQVHQCFQPSPKLMKLMKWMNFIKFINFINFINFGVGLDNTTISVILPQ
jgi:hypothetical protein